MRSIKGFLPSFKNCPKGRPLLASACMPGVGLPAPGLLPGCLQQASWLLPALCLLLASCWLPGGLQLAAWLPPARLVALGCLLLACCLAASSWLPLLPLLWAGLGGSLALPHWKGPSAAGSLLSLFTALEPCHPRHSAVIWPLSIGVRVKHGRKITCMKPHLQKHNKKHAN